MPGLEVVRHEPLLGTLVESDDVDAPRVVVAKIHAEEVAVRRQQERVPERVPGSLTMVPDDIQRISLFTH